MFHSVAVAKGRLFAGGETAQRTDGLHHLLDLRQHRAPPIRRLNHSSGSNTDEFRIDSNQTYYDVISDAKAVG